MRDAARKGLGKNVETDVHGRRRGEEDMEMEEAGNFE